MKWLFVLALLLLGGIIFVLVNYTDIRELEVKEVALVSRVIDGDTFELDSGEKVRLICIDTPEKGEYYYSEATEFLRSLVLFKEVTLVQDVSDVDDYGRLLRYVYLNDTFVNDELVLNGYARVKEFKPDTALCSSLRSSEEIAIEEKRGMYALVEGYICYEDSYNCDDFSNDEAQHIMELCGDVHNFDRNNDGIACG